MVFKVGTVVEMTRDAPYDENEIMLEQLNSLGV